MTGFDQAAAKADRLAKIGRLSAALAEIRQHQEDGDLREFASRDSPRLVAAVQAALDLAWRWDKGHCHEVMTIWEEVAADLRAAITTALLGDDGTDGN